MVKNLMHNELHFRGGSDFPERHGEDSAAPALRPAVSRLIASWRKDILGGTKRSPVY